MHTAQGVTADTMHGLVTGEESRQQLYTMLTRGRIANHLYLQVVGDGDPHSLIRPETVHPSTATELLERILARDDAARSATTLQRDQHDPAVRLADAAAAMSTPSRWPPKTWPDGKSSRRWMSRPSRLCPA